VLERDKVLDLLDEIKGLLPAELTEAKRLVAAKAEFIAAARKKRLKSRGMRRSREEGLSSHRT
jgi:hypothetical protein